MFLMFVMLVTSVMFATCVKLLIVDTFVMFVMYVVRVMYVMFVMY